MLVNMSHLKNIPEKQQYFYSVDFNFKKTLTIKQLSFVDDY